MKSFIETQFPISRLSAESYKERKSVSSQTLSGLGKWWGRKPLILVRASIIGMLMPASGDPKKDREIFLKILTMDDDGTWNRCKQSVKNKLDRAEFDKLSYAERISHCERPENVDGPSPEAWDEINAHLGTTAGNITQLVEELGKRTFGKTPRVGDSFCGGGSIPFEAARIGCEAFGSDLNPVAGLLTWASLNLLGGGKEIQEEVRKAQEDAFNAADKQITDWGIEHNEYGERAEAYLYCVEVKPEGCGYYIPLAPSWVISEKYRIICEWVLDDGEDRMRPIVKEVSVEELEEYKNKKGVSLAGGRVIDPYDPDRTWSIEALRGVDGLRRWSNDDVTPRQDDVFQERLYCIRWAKKEVSVLNNGKQKETLVRRYATPNSADMDRENKVLELLSDRFDEWQKEGFIPSKKIVKGYNTEQPTRERGWTHWHHLFTPRQLLVLGKIFEIACLDSTNKNIIVNQCLKIGIATNWHSKLCSWDPWKSTSGGIGAVHQTFYNQALNTMANYPSRGMEALRAYFYRKFEHQNIGKISQIKVLDSRDLDDFCDIWITDPPYADAVNYHELADFFLAWYDKQLEKAFPEWIADARAELAVKGDDDDFRRSMVDIYKNLAIHMPDNGLQMVQFTHQNPAVWADLGMILWAAGLKATAAWTISTETEAAGIKKGNYVQGTVCLILRKRISNEVGFLDEIYPLVEDEVKKQISSMQALDEGNEPNFNDADYQLAAYAAALKVLTQYGNIDGKDVEHEVFAVRDKKTKSDFQTVIERALGIACETLIPRNLENVWRDLSLTERYYLRGLDIECRGEKRQGMYEELARGFGVTDIKPLLKSDKANGARMHTASGFGEKNLVDPDQSFNETILNNGKKTKSKGPHPFASTPLRHLLFAVSETVKADNDPELGRQYLRDTFGQSYWNLRECFIVLSGWLATLGDAEGTTEWESDSQAARILQGRLKNDEG